MQIHEVVRRADNTEPLEWLAKALAAESLVRWSLRKYDHPRGSPEWHHVQQMITAAYAACCRLDLWDYRGMVKYGRDPCA